MQQSYLLIVISAILLFTSVSCSPENEAACRNRSNNDCGTCLAGPNCAFCKNNNKCFWYNEGNALNPPCTISQMQWQTCVGNFRVWIIIVAVLAGIVLIAIFIVVCCLCRKCKRCRIQKIERRIQQDDQRMEERRAAAEVRTAERSRVADQIRMKYGMLKDNDAPVDYTRMN